MDILTLELYDVTISEALREVNRALEQHTAMPLRILLGSDPVLRQNLQRLLLRLGREVSEHPEGPHWRLEVAPGAAVPVRQAQARPAAPVPAAAMAHSGAPAEAAPAPRPLLLTRSRLGQGSAAGRLLLLGVLRELDPAVPWVGLALEAAELLEDPQALAQLEALRQRGTPVLVSRESRLFPAEPDSFEILEDRRWQRLAGRGEITIL
jgi:hypothetical protein